VTTIPADARVSRWMDNSQAGFVQRELPASPSQRVGAHRRATGATLAHAHVAPRGVRWRRVTAPSPSASSVTPTTTVTSSHPPLSIGTCGPSAVSP
jgi:hypothetical protein